MIFTGKNLQRVHFALLDAMDELHNQIATCPNVNEYAEDIERIEGEKAAYARLAARVEKAIAKEQSK